MLPYTYIESYGAAFLVIPLKTSSSYDSTISVFISQKYHVFQRDLLHFHLIFSLENTGEVEGIFISHVLKMLYLVRCERINMGLFQVSAESIDAEFVVYIYIKLC